MHPNYAMRAMGTIASAALRCIPKPRVPVALNYCAPRDYSVFLARTGVLRNAVLEYGLFSEMVLSPETLCD